MANIDSSGGEKTREIRAPKEGQQLEDIEGEESYYFIITGGYMIKAQITTIDEEFGELEKGRGPDKKLRKKRGVHASGAKGAKDKQKRKKRLTTMTSNEKKFWTDWAYYRFKK